MTMLLACTGMSFVEAPQLRTASQANRGAINGCDLAESRRIRANRVAVKDWDSGQSHWIRANRAAIKDYCGGSSNGIQPNRDGFALIAPRLRIIAGDPRMGFGRIAPDSR